MKCLGNKAPDAEEREVVIMFNYARETWQGYEYNKTLIIGKTVNGRSFGLCSVTVDETFYGRQWCTEHGMKEICVVESVQGNKYEIWQNDCMSMRCAFPVRG